MFVLIRHSLSHKSYLLTIVPFSFVNSMLQISQTLDGNIMMISPALSFGCTICSYRWPWRMMAYRRSEMILTLFWPFVFFYKTKFCNFLDRLLLYLFMDKIKLALRAHTVCASVCHLKRPTSLIGVHPAGSRRPGESCRYFSRRWSRK